MNIITTRVSGGRIEIAVPDDWPEGVEVDICPRTLAPQRATSESAAASSLSADQWRSHILETAGKWQGEFERPQQGVYEEREPLS